MLKVSRLVKAHRDLNGVNPEGTMLLKIFGENPPYIGGLSTVRYDNADGEEREVKKDMGR